MKKSRGPWSWIAVAAAVAVLTGGLVVAKEAWDAPDPVLTGPAASSDRPTFGLDQLTGTDLVLPVNAYRYTTQSTWTLHMLAPSQPAGYTLQTVQRWIPADSTGVWRLRQAQTSQTRLYPGVDAYKLSPMLPSVHDDKASAGKFDWRADIAIGAPASTSRPVPTSSAVNLNPPVEDAWDHPDASFVNTLAADPDQLYERLRAETLADSSVHKVSGQRVVTRVLRVLELGLAYAPLRVALLKALARFPDVTLEPNATAPGGTVGLGFSAVGKDKVSFVIDTQTAQLLGSTSTDIAKTGQPDIVATETTYTFGVRPDMN